MQLSRNAQGNTPAAVSCHAAVGTNPKPRVLTHIEHEVRAHQAHRLTARELDGLKAHAEIGFSGCDGWAHLQSRLRFALNLLEIEVRVEPRFFRGAVRVFSVRETGAAAKGGD
jgi:hypothetical protein